MQPIVIHYQQRQQYILIIVAAVVVSFSLGYWFGYHSNSSDELTAVLAQLENQPIEEDGRTPDWSGESAPADDAKAAHLKESPDKKPALVTRPVTPPPVKPVEKPVLPAAKPLPVVVAPPAPKPLPVVAPPPAPVVVKPAPTPIPTPVITPPVVSAPVAASESITNGSLSAQAANTEFTVQAGVFESRDNAMKLVTELNTKGLEAYVEDFVASSGDTKFNVRFGRHPDRDQVQRKLARFKQLYTTSAYIIVVDK